MRAERVLIDCHGCGGSGQGGSMKKPCACTTCRGRGTTLRAVHTPPLGFTVRGDNDGFVSDREDCPCFEGICINADVAACRHPNNSHYERDCSSEACPIAVKAKHVDGASHA
ncbi:MAG: hypothetical protein ACREPQ_00720 [Rhodanobacter sp.]